MNLRMQTLMKRTQNYQNGLKCSLIIWLAVLRGQNCPMMSKLQHFKEKYGTNLERFPKGRQCITVK